MSNTDLEAIRRNYGSSKLEESDFFKFNSDPFNLFQIWLDEAISKPVTDATAFVLSTCDEQHFPDSRVVLLKDVINEQFVFYTHYDSAKGQQIAQQPKVAMNFFWPCFARQVRIRGQIKKADYADAAQYFDTRPLESKISAIISHQSHTIANREQLAALYNELLQSAQSDPSILKCPENWGGYRVTPEVFEFWQGRDFRLHDRIRFFKKNTHWHYQRLAP